MEEGKPVQDELDRIASSCQPSGCDERPLITGRKNGGD